MKKNNIITVLIIGVVSLGVLMYMKKESNIVKKIVPVVAETKRIDGIVKAFYEGESILKYHFDIDKKATTTERNEKTVGITITDASSTVIAKVFLSYEGGRGYTPKDFFSDELPKRIASISQTSSTTIGIFSGLKVHSKYMTWKAVSVHNGEWMIIIQYTQEKSKEGEAIAESFGVE